MDKSSSSLAVTAGEDGKDVPGFCTFCRSRCGTLNRIESGKLVSVSPLPSHPTGKAICPKGRAAPELVHSARRLTRPLKRTNPKDDPDPGFVEIEWEEALDCIAGKLARFAAESGPESVAFSFASPSAASISDSLPWLERFVWNYGSPNIIWATELCNWHKDHMHKITVGTGLPVPDYSNSDVIVLWGHNPEKVWLAQAEKIAAAVRRGAELVIIDPRQTGMTSQAQQWLRVRPGTDGALALALIRILIAEHWYDEAFVRQWSNAPFLVRADNGKMLLGRDVNLTPETVYVARDKSSGELIPVDTSRAPDPDICAKFALEDVSDIETANGSFLRCETAFSHLKRASDDYTPDRVADICKVEAEDVRQLARRIASAKAVSYYCWTGVGQHGNASQTDRAIACLFALTGQYDTKGGNVVWPDIPVLPISDYSMLPKAQAAKSLGLGDRPLGPSSGGWITGSDLYRAILEDKPYPIRALISFGSNVLSSQPDPTRGLQTLRKLELQVHCDLFLNPSAMTADIVLPVNSAWERDGWRAGFEISLEAQERLQLRPAMVPPQGQARSDFDIVAALAQRLGFGDLFANGDWDSAHDEIMSPLGIRTDQLRQSPGGVTVKLSHGFKSYADRRHDGSVTGFSTPSRRVEFYSASLHEHGYSPVPDFVHPERPNSRHPLVLTTAKNGYFCHTQHRGLATLRRKSPRPRIDIHPETAKDRNIAEFSPVEILRNGNRISMEARFDDALDPGVVVAEYGWWQAAPDIGAPAYEIRGSTDANYNSLAGFQTLDPISGAPAVRSMCCDIRALNPMANFHWTGFRKLRVVGKSAEAPGVTVLTMAPEDGKPLARFQAGQFISLRLPGAQPTATSRSYSLIGCPEAAPKTYQVAIRKLDDGMISGLLSETAMGDVLEVGAPGGNFTLPIENEFPVVLIAAGIGITPFLSLLEQVANGSGPEIHLYYGSRNGDEHAFRDRISKLCVSNRRITVRNFYSRPKASEADDFTKGRLTIDDIDPVLFERRARFYMCGPEDMISEFRKGLAKHGVPGFEVFYEKFSSPAQVPVGQLKTCSIQFKRQGKTVQWSPQDGSILDLAEKHKINLPSGCRTGQCESCTVPVIEGVFAHFIEDPDNDPDICLGCQAYPLSDLVLDI